MRTLEEIKAEARTALDQQDAGRLLVLADELRGIGDKAALGWEAFVRGNALRLQRSWDEALDQYGTAIDLFTSVGEVNAVARATVNIGVVHLARSAYDKALEFMDRARLMFEKQGDNDGLARALNNIGHIHDASGSMTDALSFHEQALALFTALGDARGAGDTMLNIGNAHHSKASYAESLRWFKKALEQFNAAGHPSGAAGATMNIGNVYNWTGHYPEALEAYEQALAVYEELGDKQGVAKCITSIGHVHVFTDSIAEAITWYERASQFFEEISDTDGVARTVLNMGDAYGNCGMVDKALASFERALVMFEQSGNRVGIIRSTGNIAAAMLELKRYDDARALLLRLDTMEGLRPPDKLNREIIRGQLRSVDKDMEGARASYTEALQIAREHNLRAEEAAIQEMLRELAREMNDLAAYIDHNNEHQRITNEIKGAEAKTRMAVQAKEKEISREREERERERAVLYSTLPTHVADRVVRGENVTDHIDAASVIFLDIVGFTSISDRIPAAHVVHLLKNVFSVCDEACEQFGVTRVKTIGDSYMAVAGVPEPLTDHATRAAQCARAMMERLDALELSMDEALGDTSWVKDVGPIKVRIGIHCGPVVAGIVGDQRLQYDVWGDTVNVASRMESTGEPGRIQVSEAFKDCLVLGTWNSVLRGETDVKGKGKMRTYWLEGR